MRQLAMPTPRNSDEDLELIEGVYPEFDVNEYLDGKLAPVFFGISTQHIRRERAAGLLCTDSTIATPNRG